jgi:uncharacterized protein
MGDRESKDLVTKTWLALLRQDFDAAFPHIADDVEWTVPGKFPGVSGTNCGKERMREILGGIGTELFPEGVAIEIRSVFAEGSVVIVEYTNRGKVFNGKLYENQYCIVFELVAGKIRRIREYLDTQNTAETLYG